LEIDIGSRDDRKRQERGQNIKNRKRQQGRGKGGRKGKGYSAYRTYLYGLIHTYIH
jgi:hypothetical protein